MKLRQIIILILSITIVLWLWLLTNVSTVVSQPYRNSIDSMVYRNGKLASFKLTNKEVYYIYYKDGDIGFVNKNKLGVLYYIKESKDEN